MWLLLILVVNVDSAYEISTKIEIPFTTEIQCGKTLAALNYTSKDAQYKVNAICKQQ
jgi:hypothetical protein